jgi:hypothetical protein
LPATSSASGLSWRAAKGLLTDERLDVVVKWRLFTGEPGAETLYRWHILQRTGGVERRSWKTSVDDYVTAARELASSMRARGFDPATPVILGSNGRLREGAHRLACGLALGLDVAVRIDGKPGRAAPWGAAWFRRHGLPENEIARLGANLAALAA